MPDDADDVGAIYERTIGDDGTVTVPEVEAAKVACVIASNGMVLQYAQVDSDGTVDVGTGYEGVDVEVIVPSDDEFERVD